MIEKGVNTSIFDAKSALTDAVNKTLEDGIPVSMISIILENILMDLDNHAKTILANERKEYEDKVKASLEEAKEKEKEQVTFVCKEDKNN